MKIISLSDTLHERPLYRGVDIQVCIWYIGVTPGVLLRGISLSYLSHESEVRLTNCLWGLVIKPTTYSATHHQIHRFVSSWGITAYIAVRYPLIDDVSMFEYFIFLKKNKTNIIIKAYVKPFTFIKTLYSMQKMETIHGMIRYILISSGVILWKIWIIKKNTGYHSNFPTSASIDVLFRSCWVPSMTLMICWREHCTPHTTHVATKVELYRSRLADWRVLH